MIIRFWGVRGSLPAPGLPSAFKDKVSEIVQRATPEDFANRESREHFIESLPPWLYGTVGGNTPCVSIQAEGSNEPLIFDCGSGIREMGNEYVSRNPKPARYHIFFSHFHWDHLLGLPFFIPAYDPSVRVDFYSAVQDMENILVRQMEAPFFPVRFGQMPSVRNFHYMEDPVSIGPVKISHKKMNHPGGSCSYKISHNGKNCIYATDTELLESDFARDPGNVEFFKDADLIILDSQYTRDEAVDKNNWGHNSFNRSVDFAVNWGIKRLVLFHHDPTYDDRKLYGILHSARQYLDRINAGGIEVFLAVEGLVISL